RSIPRIAMLRSPDLQQDREQCDVLSEVAESLQLRLDPISIRKRDELNSAFSEIRRIRSDALFGMFNSQTLVFRKRIVEFATEERLPSMFAFSELAEEGGLISSGADRPDVFRRAATYVAKILKGAYPG